MESILLALDNDVTIILGVALAMIAFAAKELRCARILLLISTALLIIRWSMWAFTTETHWSIRAAVGAIIGALVLAGFSALYKWVQEHEAKTVAGANTTNETSSPINSDRIGTTSTQLPHPAFAVSGNSFAVL